MLRGFAVKNAASKPARFRIAGELYGALKGDGLKDIEEDLEANKYGRQAAKSGKFSSARSACRVFRPEALDKKY
ncbi:MAG: hypothetical protein EOM26_05565 [Alphaproteobacteria bacterium]|nr:hypothetical protein [Alphaproteobacteria bacterium]